MDLIECIDAPLLSCEQEVWIQGGWKVVSLISSIDETEAAVDHATDVATSNEKTADAFDINAFSYSTMTIQRVVTAMIM